MANILHSNAWLFVILTILILSTQSYGQRTATKAKKKQAELKRTQEKAAADHSKVQADLKDMPVTTNDKILNAIKIARAAPKEVDVVSNLLSSSSSAAAFGLTKKESLNVFSKVKEMEAKLSAEKAGAKNVKNKKTQRR